MTNPFITDNTRANKFEFPIDGYILFSGRGHLIAAFGDHSEAMKVQKLMARDNPGSSHTVIWCNGYHTMVSEHENEGSDAVDKGR